MTVLADRIAGLTPEQRELLLRRLAGQAGAPAAPAPGAIRPRANRDGPAPTSRGQENLWMLDQMDPGSPSGNISFPVRLRGPLDAGVLERAFAEVVRRHDALRTTFPLVDGIPVQRVSTEPFAGLMVQDLSALPDAEREAEARARVGEEMNHGFSLRDGPLLRVALLRLAPDDHVLVLLLHHIVGDGWSLDVLFRELAALYGAFSRGLSSPLPELSLQYGDWAAWQRERLASGQVEALVEYWRRTLAGAPPVLELPADRPRPESFIQQAGWARGFVLPREVADGLRALCRAEGATPFGGLLAVFKALLLRWTGQEDLVVGTVVASRTRVEIEALIGYFINALALRTRLDGDPSFRQALRRVRDTVSGAYAHQDLPFEVLLEELRPEVRAGYPLVVQVQFLLQNATGELRLPGLETEELPVERSAAEVDLTLSAVEQEDGGVRFSLEYSTELWDAATVERLGHALLHLAAAAVSAPDQPLSTLALPEGAMEGLGRRGLDAPAPAPAAEAEETPAPGREWQPLALSARTAEALDAEAARLAGLVRAHPQLPLADVAYALARRPSFAHRRVVLVRGEEDAAAALEGSAPGRVLDGVAEGSGAPVVFLFPGEDAVWVGMGRGLYDAEPVFRAELDRCAELLRPHLGLDLREALYPADEEDPSAAERLGRAELAQPAAVAFGLALARVWEAWGIVPEAVMGHGVGEITAGCVAGVLPPEDALELAAARGRCIGELPPGARLDVALPPDAVESFLVPGAAVAEVNAPSACVVAGREGPVVEVERRLREAGHPVRRRPSPFGFRSPLAKLASARLLPVAARMRLSPPRVPLVSAATGTWLTDDEATEPSWWAFHFRQVVQFDAGVSELLREPWRVLLEVGPGTTLRDIIALRAGDDGAAPRTIASLDEGAGLPEPARLLGALGRLWVRGASPHWPAVWAGERHPVPLPGEDAASLAAPRESASPAAEPSARLCIHPLFQAQVARTPDAVAVEHEGRPLTYRQLGERAERLARRLAAVQSTEARVGVLLERSADVPAAQLAVLMAGCAFVPMDPAYPDDRLAYLAGDAGVRVVITRAALQRRVPAGVTALCVDEDDGAAIDLVLPEVRPENAAYVIYTSGSTGAPKGVVIPHAALVNHALAVAEEYGLNEADRVLQFASPAFDVALEEVYPTLLRGATLVIRDERAMDSLASFLAFAREKALTVWNLPSPYWHELVGELERSGASIPDALRLLVVGSEAASAEALRAWRRIAGERVAFRNAYGPTEATVTATVYAPPAEGPPADAATVPIGAPLAKVAAYVLDPRGESVAEGEAGELYLGGAGVARGYLGRPSATAAVFVPDPFSAEPGARMYRTGDRVRWREVREGDGGDDSRETASTFALSHSRTFALEFLGRVDRQVKVRGFRVEPEEIEAVLRAHPAVREAAVLLREDVPGRARLVGYAAADEGVTADELRAHLAGRLPAYMVPEALLVLPSLPVTPGGKVDRRALPAPAAPARAAGEAPREGTEARVAAVWEEVLRVESVSRGESFLGLGGNSLLAAQVVSRLHHALGVELSVPVLLEASTVAGVAEAVERSSSRPRTAPPRSRGGPVEGDWPLSLSQQRAFFMSRLQPDSLAYQFQAALRFTGALDADVLERSLEEIVRRHAIFRTSFPQSDGEPVQRVHPPLRIHLPREDLRAVPAHERRAEADRRIRAELEKPFDLARPPLIRWRLFQLEDDVWEMAHVEHHIVHDGWSFNVFLADLLEIYRAFAEGRPSPLAEPVLHFADYSAWQREWMQGPEAAEQLEFWRNQLAGAPPLLELPTDRPRPAVQRFRGGLRRMELTAAEAEALRALGRAHDATLFTTMLAGFALLMHRYSGQADVCIGSGVANRRFREVEGLIGMLVNSVVLRVGLEGDPTVAELLARTRTTTLQAFAHQDLPFDSVVQSLSPERSLSYNPLHQVTFSFDDARMPEVDVPGVEVTVREGLSNGSAKYDMNIIVAPRAQAARFSDGWEAGGLTVLWEYDADLFDAETIDGMLRQYRHLLGAAAGAPGTRVSEVPLLDDAERARVLNQWNHTDAPYPGESSIHALFAGQAARTPDAVAVVMENESLTYGEVDARANRLASHLAALGVGPETRVGLCLERGPEMVVALLAILKAGGAYVPLDPAYPAERLAFMQADSGIAVLLTQESLRAALPAADRVVVVSIDGDAREIANGDPAIPCSLFPVPSDGLAYVIYTSGSTGAPKGVAVEHRSVVRLVRGADYVSLGPDEVILQAAPVSFDAATFEIWGALLNGGRLVLVPGTAPSLEELGGAIVRHGVTTLWLTAGLFQVMVQERLESLRGVRQLLAGGDVLPVDAVAKVRARFPALRLINGYGPTENTTFTCCHTVDDAWSGGPVPIGRPISNTRVYVLDAALRPVPVGVPGELYAGGDGVARGYLGRAALTAERFVPDPFSSKPGARLYGSPTRSRTRTASSSTTPCSGGCSRRPASSTRPSPTTTS
ncbi:MAG TPA: amino acid adenylation domain-containing protein, partial [Longimicrobium sp.]|nr:amino acid adenylation domain-containing protein [Longimicrobium sp.]